MNTKVQSNLRLSLRKWMVVIVALAILGLGAVACSGKSDGAETIGSGASTDTASESNSVSTAGTQKTTAESVRESESKTTQGSETKPQAEEKPDEPNRSKLTGLLGDQDLTEQPIVAVMIDNSPNARPQAGLAKADLVYEQRVEGSSTRYLAIFQSHQPDLIGPIRSGRQNFIDRMLEYDAVFARFGGSYEADDFIAYNPGWVKDVNGMIVGSNTIWRYFDTGKVAPHNAYASYDSIVSYARDVGYDLGFKVPGYHFHAEFTEPDQALNGQKISRAVLEYGYNQTMFAYRDDLKLWERWKDGVQDLDETDGEPVLPANVIVQFAASEVYDEGGHQRIYQIGEGEGYLLTAGQQIPIHWEKADRGEATNYYYSANNEPIQLNPGQTWIEVIEDGEGRFSTE